MWTTRSSSIFSALVLVTSEHIASAQTTTRYNNATSGEPCAVLSSAAARNATVYNAAVAYACLQSIPVDVEGDIAEIEGLKVLVQFQSDLAYLKDPPPGYLYPGVDVLGSLDKIQADVQNGTYTNDYDVQNDLYRLVAATYDFHFNYVPDLVGAFSWFRNGSLISVSSDGLELPSLYVTTDLPALHTPDAFQYKPSSVAKIDGVDVETWLNEYGSINPWDHDPDANYNNIFVNLPNVILEKGPTASGFGSFNYAMLYQGNSTLITFANGTGLIMEHFAVPSCADFSEVIDGPSFFQKCIVEQNAADFGASEKRSITQRRHMKNKLDLVNRRSNKKRILSISKRQDANATTQNAYNAVPKQTAIPAPRSYPIPFVATSDLSLAGYFPENQNDTVILCCPSFQPTNDIEFQNALRSILATAKASGKTKLIIDLRGNGGGTVLDGYDMFKQLFPDATPYGGTNLAAYDLSNAMGEVMTAQVAKGNYTDAELGALTDFDAVMNLEVMLTQFDSWADFFGPLERHGGSFTEVKRFNLSDPYSLGYPIYGYINNTRPQPTSFQPNDIVMLTDALCGSVCAVFAEFMKSQAAVHTITVGGRKQYGPIQGVGGSKGANVQTILGLAVLAEKAHSIASPEQLPLFGNWSDVRENVVQAVKRLGTGSGRVNFENNIREGGSSLTPLQFVYEAADCRFFYTAPMLHDQTLLWKRTYDLRWRNGTCVQGSTGHPSSIGGSQNDTTYIESYPAPGANNTFGANVTFSFSRAYPHATDAVTATSSVRNPPSATTPGAYTGGAGVPLFSAGAMVVVAVVGISVAF